MKASKMRSMDAIAKAIREELADLKKREVALEKALALVAPEQREAPIQAEKPARRPGRPRGARNGPTHREQVTAYLAKYPDGVNQSDIGKALGLATSTVSTLMMDMEKKGQIERSTFQVAGDRKERKFVKPVAA